MSTENMVFETSVLVIGNESGSGTSAGVTTFLICQYRGKMFKVPYGTGLLRSLVPDIGARVKVKYTEMACGVPSDPKLQLGVNRIL